MPAQSPPLHSGDVVPGTKYRVLEELGAGGMGVVYRVVKPPQIQGVLKLMSTELAKREALRTRFFDEVRILAQLDHPNIVRVFDYDSLPDGTPYYVMELLQGRTLRDALATMGRLPARVAFEITRQLLEALHCAHTHDVPVVHRDIKPENIFLHSPRHGEPVVKLIDFGVIAVADRKHDGLFVGTWRYAAPEQIRGERATPATDLYAVGLILYEMLAGRGPFDQHESGSLVSQAHLHDVPPPISELVPWVPASIVELVNAALSKDPRARPHDAYAFAERLYDLSWANEGPATADAVAPQGGALASMLSTIAGASAPSEPDEQDKAREADALLEGLTPAPDGRDTFASQHSEARDPRAHRGRWLLALLTVALAAVGVVALLLVKRSPAVASQPPQPGAATVEPAAPLPVPASPPQPSAVASSAPVASVARASTAPSATAAKPAKPARPAAPASAAPKSPRDDFMRGGP